MLIAGPDATLLSLLREELARRDGPALIGVSSVHDAEEHLQNLQVAALVLDADLPGAEDSALLPLWQAAPRRRPVLLLRSATSPALRVEADAILTRPIRLGAVVSWILAILAAAEPTSEIHLGKFRLDRGQRALVDGDGVARIRLTEKEVAVLLHLARADGEIVSREALLGEVWRYAAGANTNTVATHVYRLRRKLQQSAELGAALLTETGGYRLAISDR